MSMPNVSRPSELSQLLAKHHFVLKKQLGQNFLIDARVLDKIRGAANLSAEDAVFEIGPGAGVVTQMSASVAKRVVAVEKDHSLKPVLQDALGTCDNTTILFADVLSVDLADVWKRFDDCARVVVIANLPYYVTTPILFHLIDSGVKFSDVIVMVQKEVADRLGAPAGGKDYGALTIAIQYRAEVLKIGQVPPSSFMPPPGVDSTIVHLRWREKPAVEVVDEALLFRVVRSAFATRRKTLLNALSGHLAFSKDTLRDVLSDAGVDSTRRGETLALQEFAEIANRLAALRDLQ